MIHTPHQHVVTVMPKPEQFAAWVKQSIVQLDMRASNFLLDDQRPGSKNRVANFLRNPDALCIGMATRLQCEILTTAVRKGVYLEPMQIVPLHKIIVPDSAPDGALHQLES